MARLTLESGRRQQKLRTKSALVSAARELISRGETPTIDEVARAAGVSRTSAYRYFASQAELLAAAHPEIERTSLLGGDAPAGVEERVDAVVREITRIVRASESQQRTMLRLSLDPGVDRSALLLRQGRAIGWLEEALEPMDLRPAARRRLAIAIRSAIGIEAYVWLRDVAGLTPAGAVQTMRWSARALLRTALDEERGP